MCPSSGLWEGVLDCDSQFTILSPPLFDWPQLWRFTSVCSSLYLLTRTHCAPMFTLDPSVVDLVPPCTCWRKDTITDCALCIPVSHDRRRACLFLLLVYQAFWAWCRSRSQSLIRGYPPQSQSAQIPTPEQHLWAHRWYFCTSSASFTFKNPSSLSVDRVNSDIYIRSSELHWLRPHLVACPRNNWRRKTLDRGCTVSLDFFWQVLSPLYPVSSPPALPCCRFLETLFVVTACSC